LPKIFSKLERVVCHKGSETKALPFTGQQCGILDNGRKADPVNYKGGYI